MFVKHVLNFLSITPTPSIFGIDHDGKGFCFDSSSDWGNMGLRAATWVDGACYTSGNIEDGHDSIQIHCTFSTERIVSTK